MPVSGWDVMAAAQRDEGKDLPVCGTKASLATGYAWWFGFLVQAFTPHAATSTSEGREARVSIAAHTETGEGRGKARVFVALTHLRHAIGERRLMTGAGADAGADAGAGAEVAAGDGRLRSEPTFCMGFVSVKSMGSCSSRLEAGMDLGRGRVVLVAAVVAAGSRGSPQDLGKCL